MQHKQDREAYMNGLQKALDKLMEIEKPSLDVAAIVVELAAEIMEIKSEIV